MKKYQKQHSGLFLIEIMVSILFFSLAAALCLQLFAKASLKSSQSIQLTHGVLIASSAAEALERGCSSAEELAVYFPEAVVEDDALKVYYDKDWQTVSPGEGRYLLSVSFSSKQASLVTADILVLQDDNSIYELSVSCLKGGAL